MKDIKAKHRQFFHGLDLGERPMLMASNFLDAYRDAYAAKPDEARAVILSQGDACRVDEGAVLVYRGDSVAASFEPAATPDLVEVPLFLPFT